ncbi:Rrf2 family transcriptional regulator [Paenibacillus baekrokdamisoli]|uniref:Rrf2 family transcriptional regulator n=1 Tax=Paenibacillus baekrokdamisoli TaxID=1712516 RepID=A0A3G9J3E1_9BACL|nr:Rrf2 family transcriptional regulator [Paenibacillus baekrokdamisoli]MBB3068081.1 Rrf2 family protein [Paenibacillus baekrokdamisoli]BBH22875.1 Rrf2 family transcriptional regulator [Paenibacillus baekrokdamisoli]
MKYSKATNYALHTMVYLVVAPKGKTIGVRPLADIQSVSPTYLSKILTKLVKAGLIESTPGVNGGYKLSTKEDISFLSIIQAVEGTDSLFDCGLGHDRESNRDCFIQHIMMNAEHEMEHYLKERTIQELADKVDESLIAFVNREAQ